MPPPRPGGEPTEQPTPKRLRDARERGQVARSAELTAAGGFAAAAAVVVWYGGAQWARLRDAMAAGIGRAASAEDPAALVWPALQDGLDTVARVSAPAVAAAALFAAVAGFFQVRGLLVLAPLAPDLSRIDPLAGARRLLSGRTWVELARSLVKVAVVAALAIDLLAGRAPGLARLAGAPLGASMAWTAEVAAALVLRVAAFYAVVGAVDYLWQRHVTRRDLMMTRDEVRREHREQEGDPHHKAERQRLHRDLLQHQMVEAVRTADCVIVNPDHIAVALRYDAGQMAAPQVVAVGERLVAEQIKQIARRHGVPIYRDVPLARSLAQLELGAEIPEALYEAVAAVLRFVHDQRGGGDAR
jgi:flagellar biosynthesis protein FlhB